MPDAYSIAAATTPADLDAVAALFQAYARSLPVDLAYQDFAAELAALPGKYAAPAGALLLARTNVGEPVGCIGLRALTIEGCCEMKRLYLTPAARGLGLGRALTEAVIQRSRQIGYRQLRLDTLPTMTTAAGLYRGMGFIEIAPYYEPTPPGTLFFALDL